MNIYEKMNKLNKIIFSLVNSSNMKYDMGGLLPNYLICHEEHRQLN